ncbi:GtrA family protein [Dysgonomonas sp. Marseille-P4361]|uniref:GtrA family protein n=1 Tax=Dysgonomonas sp. Marseille-P4361 TaxID=2161820 RepID=UPI000D554056|nr:GtrA family protein [Dysgonomonas sp. Marseille-P4361]
MKKQVKDLTKKKGLRELVKYGIVGSVGMVIDMGVFYLLAVKFSVQYPFSIYIRDFLGDKIPLYVIDADVSHVISSLLAITNNFILNSYFTFKVTDNKFQRFLSFVGIAAIGLVISTMLITLLVGKFQIDEMYAKIIATCFVAAMQFVVNKFVTFKSKQVQEPK